MLINIIIGLFIIGITVTIQGFGTEYWLNHIFKNYLHLPKESFKKKSAILLISTAIFLLLLNVFQAFVWAFTFYILPGVTEFESLEKAIYFSLITFTTLGYGDITISSANRILAGIEAINGVLLIGWSTAFMFSVVQYTWKNTIKMQFKDENKK